MFTPLADDNGTEFCEHDRVAERLKTKFYFTFIAHGSESLLRQYILKGTDLRQVTGKQIKWIKKQLNLRPRKFLGYKQPAVVF